jgi:hypothetical protein
VWDPDKKMAAAKKKWRPPRKNGGRQEKMAAAIFSWRAIFSWQPITYSEFLRKSILWMRRRAISTDPCFFQVCI